MTRNPSNALYYTLLLVVLLGSCLLLASMGMRMDAMPGPIFLISAGGLGLGMLGLLWQSPPIYAMIASTIALCLPSTGPWEAAGLWVAGACMALAGFRWWWHLLRGQADWRKGFGWPIAITGLWACWGIVAAVGSPDISVSIQKALPMAMIVGGALACGHFLGRQTRLLGPWLLFASLAILMLLFRAWLRFGELAKTAPAPYALDGNFFAAMMVLLVPLLSWVWLNRARLPVLKPLALRIIVAATLLLLLLGILRFNSRGAWLSLALVISILPTLVGSKWKWQLLSIGIFLGIGLLVFWIQPSEHQPLAKPISRLQSMASTQDFSNRERIMRWTCAWRMGCAKPILGHGPGRFAPLFKNFLQDRQEADQIAWWFGWRFGAHSDHLNALAETGFPGWFLFWAMVLSWARAILKTHFQAGRRNGRVVAIVASLLTWLFHGLFNDLLTSPAIAVWVFLLLGILAVLPENEPAPNALAA